MRALQLSMGLVKAATHRFGYVIVAAGFSMSCGSPEQNVATRVPPAVEERQAPSPTHRARETYLSCVESRGGRETCGEPQSPRELVAAATAFIGLGELHRGCQHISRLVEEYPLAPVLRARGDLIASCRATLDSLAEDPVVRCAAQIPSVLDGGDTSPSSTSAELDGRTAQCLIEAVGEPRTPRETAVAANAHLLRGSCDDAAPHLRSLLETGGHPFLGFARHAAAVTCGTGLDSASFGALLDHYRALGLLAAPTHRRAKAALRSHDEADARWTLAPASSVATLPAPGPTGGVADNSRGIPRGTPEHSAHSSVPDSAIQTVMNGYDMMKAVGGGPLAIARLVFEFIIESDETGETPIPVSNSQSAEDGIPGQPALAGDRPENSGEGEVISIELEPAVVPDPGGVGPTGPSNRGSVAAGASADAHGMNSASSGSSSAAASSSSASATTSGRSARPSGVEGRGRTVLH